MKNTLYKIWREELGQSYDVVAGRFINKRLLAAETYAWGIPDEGALEEISKHQPIIEIGAGLGYWARLLEDRQVRIKAFDPRPPKKGWTKVLPGGAEVLPFYPYRTLLLCWVPEKEAQGIVEVYEGDKVIWIGEPIKFPNFREVKMLEIPQWSGLEDALFIFKRRR